MTQNDFIPAEALSTAVSAFANILAAEDRVAQERAKQVQLDIEQDNDTAERDRIRRQEDEAKALRHLDGESAVPKRPRRVARLAALDEQIPARAAAMRLQERRISEAEAALVEPKQALVGPVLDIVSHLQGTAVGNSREVLATLADPFTRLIAADQIRQATIGDRFAVPDGRKAPFSGPIAIRKFVNAIPDRFRPPELEEHRLFDGAHAISSAIIAQIQGEKQ